MKKSSFYNISKIGVNAKYLVYKVSFAMALTI